MTPPVRIAVVNDYELVVRGLASMLEPFSDRIEVVEIDTGGRVISDVEIALYDTFGQPQGEAIEISDVLAPGVSAKVVVFSWNHAPDLVDASFAAGVAGYIDKSVSAEEVVSLLERVHQGECVRPHRDPEDVTIGDVGAWPGGDRGLSPREAEVLALICQGFSNDDICKRTYISINTLKGYIRSLYAKIGVTDRANAILWGIDHGFRPDHFRRIET